MLMRIKGRKADTADLFSAVRYDSEVLGLSLLGSGLLILFTDGNGYLESEVPALRSEPTLAIIQEPSPRPSAAIAIFSAARPEFI